MNNAEQLNQWALEDVAVDLIKKTKMGFDSYTFNNYNSGDLLALMEDLREANEVLNPDTQAEMHDDYTGVVEGVESLLEACRFEERCDYKVLHSGKFIHEPKVIIQPKKRKAEVKASPAEPLTANQIYLSQITPEPVRPAKSSYKSEVLNAFKKSAYVLGGVLAPVIGYNYFSRDYDTSESSVNYLPTEVSPLERYVSDTKKSLRIEITKGAAPETQAPQPKAVISEVKPTPAPAKATYQASQRKVITERPTPSPDPYLAIEEPYISHIVEAGDRFADLYQDYQARGGSLSWNDYMKAVRVSNPQIQNINRIYFGEIVTLPQY